jgi:hypothetical protein
MVDDKGSTHANAITAASEAGAKQAVLEHIWKGHPTMSADVDSEQAEGEIPHVNTLAASVANTQEEVAPAVRASARNSSDDGGAGEFPWLFVALMAMVAVQLLQLGQKALARHLRQSGLADGTNVFQQLDRVGMEKRKRSLAGDADEYAGLDEEERAAAPSGRGRMSGGRGGGGGHVLNDACDYRDASEPRTRLMAF